MAVSSNVTVAPASIRDPALGCCAATRGQHCETPPSVKLGKATTMPARRKSPYASHNCRCSTLGACGAWSARAGAAPPATAPNQATATVTVICRQRTARTIRLCRTDPGRAPVHLLAFSSSRQAFGLGPARQPGPGPRLLVPELLGAGVRRAKLPAGLDELSVRLQATVGWVMRGRRTGR